MKMQLCTPFLISGIHPAILFELCQLTLVHGLTANMGDRLDREGWLIWLMLPLHLEAI
jgi:hypothetical protein